MCDMEIYKLREILQSLETRIPKIMLWRAEEVFPALKESLVSVLCIKWLYLLHLGQLL
jgi:hypothetical protein